jgi:hypothetical protein
MKLERATLMERRQVGSDSQARDVLVNFHKEVAMPDTITLSENAVALLRSRIGGRKSPARDIDRAGFDELVAAGLMEPDGAGDYRFADDDAARREEVLRAEEERIERGRFEAPDASHLTEAGKALLRRLVVDSERVDVTAETRSAYRELAAARIMYPLHGFIGGKEAAFRFTYWGWHGRHEWLNGVATPHPSPGGSPSPHG